MQYKASGNFKGAVGALGLHTNSQKLLLLPCSNSKYCPSKTILFLISSLKNDRLLTWV
jgi:hypothetical protein